MVTVDGLPEQLDIDKTTKRHSETKMPEAALIFVSFIKGNNHRFPVYQCQHTSIINCAREISLLHPAFNLLHKQDGVRVAREKVPGQPNWILPAGAEDDAAWLDIST